MTKPFDPTKPCMTRDGRKVRILTTDRKDDELPVVGLYEGEDGDGEGVGCWARDGSHTNMFGTPGQPTSMDLINVPERHVKWINVYRDKDIRYAAYPSLKEAHEQRAGNRIACIRIEFEEGEGLS